MGGTLPGRNCRCRMKCAPAFTGAVRQNSPRRAGNTRALTKWAVRQMDCHLRHRPAMARRPPVPLKRGIRLPPAIRIARTRQTVG